MLLQPDKNISILLYLLSLKLVAKGEVMADISFCLLISIKNLGS